MTAEIGLILALAAGPAVAQARAGGEQAFFEGLGSPNAVLSGLGWKGLAATAPQAATRQSKRSGLSFGPCALGSAEACLRVLQCGLEPEDRAAVTLGAGGTVFVDAAHASASGNFAALRKAAASDARTVIEVLSPKDEYRLRTTDRFPPTGLVLHSTPMGHPDTGNGFLGYTFFEFLGKYEGGIIYSPGAYTSVVANAGQEPAKLAVTIYHELRHVLLGDFGRSAPKAKHGAEAVEAAIAETERETGANAAGCGS